jgi:hypothetical protein
VREFKFTHANFLLPDEPRLELSVYKRGNYADTDANEGVGKIPLVTMYGSDMPGFILRPLMGGKKYQDQVVVMNTVTWVDPVDYIVLPLLARYFDLETAGRDAGCWSGQAVSRRWLVPSYSTTTTGAFVSASAFPTSPSARGTSTCCVR